MSIDALGGVFSDLSLAFKPKFDVVAGVAYTLVVVSSLLPSPFPPNLLSSFFLSYFPYTGLTSLIITPPFLLFTKRKKKKKLCITFYVTDHPFSSLPSFHNSQVLDGVVIILALILNPLAKKRRAREAEAQTATNPTQTLHVDSSGVTMTTPGDLTQGNLGTNRSPPPLSPLSVPDNVMIDSARQAFDRTDSTDCKTKGEVITLPSDLGAKV